MHGFYQLQAQQEYLEALEIKVARRQQRVDHLAKRHGLVSKKGAALAEKRVGCLFIVFAWADCADVFLFCFVFDSILILIHTSYIHTNFVFYLGFELWLVQNIT